jgi:hypothetical protein
MGEKVVWFVAGLVAAGASSAQMRTMPVKEASHFKLVTVADGVYAAIAKAGDRSAVGNAGFIAGKDGVVVVDAFATASAAEELFSEIRRVTGVPVPFARRS